MDSKLIEQAIDLRVSYAGHLSEALSAEQRLEQFEKLQLASFEVLIASQVGYQNFLRRNYLARRIEVVDGEYQPVSSARRSQQP